MTNHLAEMPPRAALNGHANGTHEVVAQSPQLVELYYLQLEIDPEIQPRAELDTKYVSELAQDIERGAEMEPVDAFDDGEKKWLSSGFHRVAAAKIASGGRIKAWLHKGTRRDAQEYAIGSNSRHGKRRTNADKRREVKIALELWPLKSFNEISKICGVSDTFVGDVKRSDFGLTEVNPVRTGADGRTINTANIGRKAESDEQGSVEQGSEGEVVDGYGRPVSSTPLGIAGTVTTEVVNADLPEEPTAPERLTKSEESKLSDEAWLDTLPLRAKLRAEKIPERMFEEAALLWRKLQKPNNELRREINTHINTRNSDDYTMRVRTYIDTPHPAQWKFSRGANGGFLLW